MNAVFAILAFQIALGGFDNLWHHELQARLPQRHAARYELTLHAARELIYGLVFFGLAWSAWHGVFALVLAMLLAAELVITMADFLEEDRTRHLPSLERVLHTLLAVSYGTFLAALAPVLLAWWRLPTGIVGVRYGLASWLLTAGAMGVTAWSVRNGLAVWRLFGSQAGSREGSAHGPGMDRAQGHVRSTVLITGATGFIGTALVGDFVRDGWRVVVLARDLLQARGTFGADVWVVDRLESIPSETRIEAIVNLAGARVLGMPWTPRRRRELLDSRVSVTAAIIGLMRRLSERPRVMVSASAVGYYGVDPATYRSASHGLENGLRDETSPPRPGQFQSDLCVAIEHEARRAETIGVRVVQLRFGVVLGREGGAYPALALAAKFGFGAVLGSGRQPAPWIHLDDAVGLVRFALAHRMLGGPINAVAPDLCTQARFTRSLAASFGCRARLMAPAAPIRLLLGEMSELLLEGRAVVPRRATEAGYVFRFAALDAALRALARQKGKGDGANTGQGPRSPVCLAMKDEHRGRRPGALPGFDVCETLALHIADFCTEQQAEGGTVGPTLKRCYGGLLRPPATVSAPEARRVIERAAELVGRR